MGVIKKPKLTAEGQVEHLVSKGVKFNIVSEEEAIEYLATNSNYFKLTAYRKNFEKHTSGPNAGKYQDLEFALLKDLAIIDMRLRYTLVHMALDIEHFAKVRLLRKIELEPVEDGYSIVTDFISFLDPTQKERLETEIKRNKNNLYCGAMIDKYRDSYPIWAFVEVIPFGRLLSLYLFCAARFDHKSLKDQYYLLLAVRQLRNAVAHNNCIMNDLSQKAKYPTHLAITRELGKIQGLTRAAHRRKMNSARIQQIVNLLFTHKKLVTSRGIHENRSKALHEFTDRMFRNISCYQNMQIISTFDFLQKVIDSWFPLM